MISGSVRDGWLAFTKPLEGYVPWPYLDVRGLVTIGYGCLVDPISRAAIAGIPDDVWRAVKAMPGAMAATRYDQGWRATQEQLQAVALARLDADVPALESFFGDLSAYPEQVQLVVCSLDWACGAGWPNEFPRGSAALKAGDWAAAAAELHIREDGNQGVAPRNARDRALLVSLLAAA
jgi:GH24 family phage-related lysozyme (muramidase)